MEEDVLSLETPAPEPVSEEEHEIQEHEIDDGREKREFDVGQASRLKGPEARKWFAKQLMIPEWMIDVPDRLNHDWYVFARPAGKRCFVVSSKGTTVSRLRNGAVLHHFPSALPSGSRKKTVSDPSQSYSVLDCIFHELDQTYYVIDMVCWRGYSLHDCTAEFRFFWLNSKLVESGACDPPSTYHKYRFSQVLVYNCDESGLQMAYSGVVPYVKDGLLLYNKILVWKDENFSQYVIDTDSNGHVPIQQQVVLELQEDGKLTTSDDPPVVFGSLDGDFIQKVKFLPSNPSLFGIFSDSFSQVMFQFMSHNTPLRINDLFASMNSSSDQESGSLEVEMVG
ncbi:hypothetical protein QQ045_028894 [Rhodiola kirilowii]